MAAVKKSKMTFDKIAQMTQSEFSAVRKDMDKGFSEIHKHFATKDDLKSFATKEDLKSFATKDDLKIFATKEDLRNFATKDDLRSTEVKILQAVDVVVARFDRTEKEEAAHNLLHKRTADELHHHDQRIKKLEAKFKRLIKT